MNPFGEVSCEEEIELLGDRYRDFFFQETPFNEKALAIDVYLIIGRRGSGKSSLAHYLGFQDKFDKAVLIDVDEPSFYESALLKISKDCGAELNVDISIPRMAHVWTLGIWSLLFHRFYGSDPKIAVAAELLGSVGRVSIRNVLARLFEVLLRKVDASGDLARDIQNLLQNEAVVLAQQHIINISKKKPIFIAIDTIERYRTSDLPLMVATSALIQASFWFNRKWAKYGLHIKTFLPSEVFPSISEEFSLNTTKFIQNELYLLWRPKDLIRLVCWRLFKHFESQKSPYTEDLSLIAWDSFDSVVKRAWQPFFGHSVSNKRGVKEASLVYLLRHTQMRPRQLVILCNQIAKAAEEIKCFPKFESNLIRDSVWSTESKLATEVINSYKGTYTSVGHILGALKGIPARFKGNILDKVASSTISFWPDNQYSPANFRQLVAELGIVGRVRSVSEKDKIIEADFEYAITERLALHERDDCVIHPMFYKNLSVVREEGCCRVLPFPDHPDFEELRNGF